jgi:Mn2+/Fe2+ NRAMP family transporter
VIPAVLTSNAGHLFRSAVISRFGMLGPGIVYAAMAIGVSHLVQSTRAGAVYGLSMAAVIVLIALVKYPGMRFGTQYAAASGRSLAESYLDQGRLPAVLYVGSTLGTMWFALAAITLTTAGLVQTVFALGAGTTTIAAALLALAGALLVRGRYRLLERVTKALVLLLAVLVLIAAALAAPMVDWRPSNFVIDSVDVSMLVFVVAMAGWMPTPMEGAVLTSVWARSRAEETGERVSPAAAGFDFNVGYVTAIALALGFLVLGVAMMHEPGIAPDLTAGGFANQVIALFTGTIGPWSFYLIGGCAIAVMASTLLTVMDGFPRQFVFVVRHLTGRRESAWVYPAFLATYGAGALVVIVALRGSFGTLIDFATSLGFVMAPVFAVLNHRAMTSADVPSELRPGPALLLWSLTGIALLATASSAYFYFLLFG